MNSGSNYPDAQYIRKMVQKGAQHHRLQRVLLGRANGFGAAGHRQMLEATTAEASRSMAIDVSAVSQVRLSRGDAHREEGVPSGTILATLKWLVFSKRSVSP